MAKMPSPTNSALRGSRIELGLCLRTAEKVGCYVSTGDVTNGQEGLEGLVRVYELRRVAQLLTATTSRVRRDSAYFYARSQLRGAVWLGTRAAPLLLERLSFAFYGEHLSDKFVFDVETHFIAVPASKVSRRLGSRL